MRFPIFLFVRTSINVTFFNEFGDKFLEEIDTIAERPLIVIITSAKASEYNSKFLTCIWFLIGPRGNTDSYTFSFEPQSNCI